MVQTRGYPENLWYVLGLAVLLANLSIDMVLASRLVMSQSDIQNELIGPPMKGVYDDGSPWDETYFADGHIVYQDATNNWVGKWSFRGKGFCTFYNGGVNGGCWRVLKTSENCYEFYPVNQKRAQEKDKRRRKVITWIARGWRRSHASTCDPEVGV